jgi:hypothetical protein
MRRNSLNSVAILTGSLLLGLISGAELLAQTAYPMLMSLRPVAVQVGTTADVEVKSRYTMFGAYQVLVSGEGVTGEVTPSDVKQDDAAKKPTVEKLPIKITVATDAVPGVRDVRIATPQGVSTVGQLVVVRDPVVVETGNNDTPAGAQQIALPAAVCGSIDKNEDVDFFRFHTEAGTALAFQVRCARLEDRIHDLQTHADPILTLRTAVGATIVSSDNNSYYADPVLAHRFEQAGDYLLEIRDVRYQGNQYWEYCLEINSRPVVECVHPLAVSQGQAETLQPLGHLLTDDARLSFTAPTSAPPGLASFQLPLGDELTNPVPLMIADVPLTRESETANDSPDAAQPIAVPSGVSGRIDREGDVDYYAFAARKGEALSLEIVARRARSELDSHLRILDAKGKQLALNDDLRLGKRTTSDSWLENWTAPADGKYVVEVRDVHLRGGPLFPYFLKVTRSQPYFELYLDAEAEDGRFDRRVVAGDHSGGLQLAHPLVDRRSGQTDQTGQLRVGRSRVDAEGIDETSVDPVDLSHKVHAPPPRVNSHSDIGVFRGQRGSEVVHCVSARAEP